MVMYNNMFVEMMKILHILLVDTLCSEMSRKLYSK